MEQYNKIVESLSVKFHKARYLEVTTPVRVNNAYQMENMLIWLKKGALTFGQQQELVPEGSMLFVPAGSQTTLTYGGMHTTPHNISSEEFLHSADQYLKVVPLESNTLNECFYFVSFDAKVFDTVNFFSSLEIPPFVLEYTEQLGWLLENVVSENLKRGTTIGKNRLISLYTDAIAVEIIRYILDKRLFVERLATNSTYFKDQRLIDILSYIKENLSQDLSNKTLANIANVSEDYVGQYFKLQTGINPQDYIEYQRMEAAIVLLRTSKKSIRDIGYDVGYKDTAYFCRRFKMMFGIPAGKMRRRDSLMGM